MREVINGCPVLASYYIPEAAGMKKARIVLVESRQQDGNLLEFITAQQNVGEQGWYWGHYFTISSPGDTVACYIRSVKDFCERVALAGGAGIMNWGRP